MRNLLNYPEVLLCLTWVQARLGKIKRPRWGSVRGQAVMEYMLLLIFIGMLAALIYSFIGPRIEKLLVNMAKDWIAGNVAGESTSTGP